MADSQTILKILPLTLIVTFGCGKSGTTLSSSGNVINTVYSSIQSAAPDFSTTTAASFSTSSQGNFETFAAVGSNLSVANSFTSVDGGATNKTPLQYIESLYGNSSQNSIFKRAKMPFLISCTVDTLATRGNALYATSQTSMVMSSSVVGVCGSASDFMGGSGSSLVGTTVTFTIANLADTTNYDQIITMPGSSNSQFGGNDQYMYIRNNSSTLNFMHIEVKTDNSEVTVSVLHYNKATSSGHFQYATKSGTHNYSVYRIYLDAVSNVGRVYTHHNMGSGISVSTHAGSTFYNQSFAALSVSWVGMTSHTSATLTDANACMALTTAPPSVSTDNTLVCNGQTISAVSGASALVTSNSTMDGSTIRTWASTPAQGALKFPTFTSSTILTSSFGL
jgi:hypothetical protein